MRPAERRNRVGRIVHRVLTTATLAVILHAPGCGGAPMEHTDAGPEPEPVTCSCEIRSWLVLGRGRHLYARVECPDGYESLNGTVEFTSASLREDYKPPADERLAPRIARMTPGLVLSPLLVEPDDRQEALVEISLEQARCLQRDRVFSAPYFIIGTNSNTGLRAACESCDIALPDAVLNGGGVLGEFPGVDLSAGEELSAQESERYGVAEPASPMIDYQD